MDELIGRNFGGYELRELLGPVAETRVFKGFNDRLSRWAAVKLIRLPQTVLEADLIRFRREAQAIASLRHPNIVRIYGYGEEDGWAYLIMKYEPDGSLGDRIDSHESFSWQRTLKIVVPAAEALAFAHNRGIVHKRIKPANILLTQDDTPRLTDFELPKVGENEVVDSTIPGSMLGDMTYAAPEQLLEIQLIDGRADVYALSIVCYEMLAGQLPFEGEASFDILMARLTDTPRPINEANPAVPSIFGAILSRAMDQNPDERYQTMAEFSEALLEAGNQLDIELESQDTITVEPTGEEAAIGLRLVESGEILSFSNQSELIIGRASKKASSSAPDVDLAPYGGRQGGVSRRHGRLLCQNGEWLVEDLGSTNGTYINGVKIAPDQPTTVRQGDMIRFGQIGLQLERA